MKVSNALLQDKDDMVQKGLGGFCAKPRRQIRQELFLI